MHLVFTSALLLLVLAVTTAQQGRCYIRDLRNLDHVSTESQSFTFSGDKASILCDDGYTAESKMPLCQNGTWDLYHWSLCKESDCQIPRIFSGSVKEERLGDWEWNFLRGYQRSLNYITVPQGTMVSSRTKLWFYCDKPYTVLGTGKIRAEIRCFKGRWSMDLKCLRTGEPYVPSTVKPVLKPSTPTLAGIVATTAEYIPPSTTRSSWSVEGLSPANVDEEKPQTTVTTNAPTEPPLEECFCEYSLGNSKIVAHAEGKRLIYRDKVRKGSSVEFRCLHVGFDRFRGNRGITCNDCQPWHSSDFPDCVSPEKGDAVILLNSHSIVLENGNIELLKGDSLNFTCAAMETALFPEWNAPMVPGVSYIRERKEREEYGDVVYFNHLQIQNASYEHEGTYECSIQGKHKTMIHIIVTDKCRIPRIDGGSVKKETLGDWYWTFTGYKQSLIYKTIPPESSVSTDSVLWLFCDKPYSVHGDSRKRVSITCIKGRWSMDLQCLLEGESYVPSTAASILENFMPTLKLASGRSTTTEKSVVHSTPTTSRDLTSPLDVDEEKSRAVSTSFSSTEPPTEECFCKYPLDENSDIVAHADGKRLTFGDRVRNGSKVIFHCLHVGYHRFRGHREIICSNCNPWHSGHFPSCTAPIRGDAIIVVSKDVNVLKDGNIEIHKGQNINFTCVVMETAVYPEWSAPKVSGISFIRERTERKDYEDVLYLSHLQIRNADYDNGGIYECSAGSNHKTMIRTVITDPHIRCPELPGNNDILVRYEMERREKSKAWFSCPKEGQKLVGKSVLTCLSSGEWSDATPYCSADCKVPTINRGSFKEEKLGDWYWTWVRWERNVTYVTIPPGRIVPSGTVLWFYCDKPYSVQGDGRQKRQIRCLQGRWPKDLQCLHESQCSVHDLAVSIPDDVEIDMTGVNDKFVPSGSEVGLKCRDSSIINGNSKALCGDQGNWVFGNFQCVTGCRLNIDPSSHLRIQPVKEGYRFGDIVILSCPPGEEITTHVEMLMCLGDGWSDSLPDCRAPEQSGQR